MTPEHHSMKGKPSNVNDCLEICSQALWRIDEIYVPLTTKPTRGDLTLADIMTLRTLKSCARNLRDTLTWLHSIKGDGGINFVSQYTMLPHNITEDIGLRASSLQSRLHSTHQNVTSSPSERRVHVLENISVGHDGKQLLVSTSGELFEVRGVSAENRATLIIGSMSDASLQEYFRILAT